jgi:hypothetical protein
MSDRVPDLDRRPLNVTRRAKLLRDLEARWRLRSSVAMTFWDPATLPAEVLPFQRRAFREELTAPRVAQILLAHGLRRIDQIQVEGQFAGEWTLDPRNCSFQGHETVWTSGKVDWLIFASHEPVIVVGGGWLLKEIQAVWPNWKERISTGWGEGGEFN